MSAFFIYNLHLFLSAVLNSFFSPGLHDVFLIVWLAGLINSTSSIRKEIDSRGAILIWLYLCQIPELQESPSYLSNRQYPYGNKPCQDVLAAFEQTLPTNVCHMAFLCFRGMITHISRWRNATLQRGQTSTPQRKMRCNSKDFDSAPDSAAELGKSLHIRPQIPFFIESSLSSTDGKYCQVCLRRMSLLKPKPFLHLKRGNFTALVILQQTLLT